jgi:hypothetical protein
MPSYRAREDLGLFEQLLDVVLAEVSVCGIWGLVEGEDIVCRLELRYGYEADLGYVLAQVKGAGAVIGMHVPFGCSCLQH